MSRNTAPIVIVLIAATLVVGAFEVLDAFTSSSPNVATNEEAGPELEGVASLAGLIKVAVFLGVGALVARVIRRRIDGERR